MEQVATSPLQEEEHLSVQETQIFLTVATEEVPAAEKVSVPDSREEVSVAHTANNAV